MLTIGQMARAHGLTTKTLRHYDQIGLFRPQLTGRDNGYRYYAPAQLPVLGRIVWLRQLGLGLEEIGQLAASGALSEPAGWQLTLQQHAANLAASIARQQQVLDQLGRYLAQPERSLPAMQTPQIIDYPAVRLIGMRWHCQDQGTIAEMWQRFVPREQEIRPLAPIMGTFGVCEPLADGLWQYLAGLPVTEETTIPDGMHEVRIPARRYARVEHHGTVATLPETFRAALSEWLPAAGLHADEGIEFEFCGERFLGPQHPQSVVEIYIPLRDSELAAGGGQP